MVDELVKRTLKELVDDSISTTYDDTMFNFIEYIIKVNMAAQDVSFIEAFRHMKSDDFHDEFNMYLENYFGMYHKPKYSPDDFVWIPKEQLDELLKAAGR